MASITAAAGPVKNVVLPPINEGTFYTTRNTIVFRIGAADVNQLLVDDSYLTFDFRVDVAAGDNFKYVLRDSGMVFSDVRVKYAGEVIYQQQYNIQAQLLKFAEFGSDYLEENPANYATSKTVLGQTAVGTFTSAAAPAQRNVIGLQIRLNELLPIFHNVHTFPFNFLRSWLEIELDIADPNRCFAIISGIGFGERNVANNQQMNVYKQAVDGFNAEMTLKEATGLSNFSIEKPRLYLEYFEPSDQELNAITAKHNSGQMTWDYYMPSFGLRSQEISNIPAIDSNPTQMYNIPFSIVTKNVDKMLVWASPTNNNAVTLRVSTMNANLKYGINQSPFTPVPDNSSTNPIQYRDGVFNVFDLIGTYYHSINKELQYSFLKANVDYYKQDLSFILGANYTIDDELGANSDSWNSQYTLQAMMGIQAAAPVTVMLNMAVYSRYKMFIKDGQLQTYNE